jgi:hypothetical protein
VRIFNPDSSVPCHNAPTALQIEQVQRTARVTGPLTEKVTAPQ